MSDFYSVRERELWHGDLNAVAFRVDLEHAIQSAALTPRQRQCVALHYFACLSQTEAARVLGISQPVVHAHLSAAMREIVAYMSGSLWEDAAENRLYAVPDAPPDDCSALDRWLADVADNAPEWWSVPSDVWREIRERFDWDVPSESSRESNGPGAYPILTKHARQLRRECPCPVVYPRFDGFGARKDGGGRRERFYRAT